MNGFTNLRIATKIGALLLLLGLGALGGVLYQSFQMRALDTAYSAMVTTRIPNNVEIMAGRAAVDHMAYSAYRTMAYDGRSAEARMAAEEHRAAAAEYRDRFAHVLKREPALDATLGPLVRTANEIERLTASAVSAGLRNDNEQARRLLVETDRLEQDFGKAIVALRQARAAEINAESAALTAATESGAITLLIMQVLGLAGAIGLAIFLARKTISAPLVALERAMRAISGGNHDADVPGTGRKDEVGDMAASLLSFRDSLREQALAEAEKAREDAARASVIESLSSHLDTLAKGDLTKPITADYPVGYTVLRDNYNAAVESLRDLITSVIDSTHAIQTGSGEIQTASEDLARRTESSAASLEESAAAITQMGERIQAAADSSMRTVQRADQAIATVGSGRATAEEAVEAMRRVSENARGIDSVIEGLDKIAFQTRVLAMNAAVEAGRAGEAGRGFAVVADLVGQLAMRSEEEAKRAREQLTATQADVEVTNAAVTKVDEALVAISTDVESVHELLAGLARDNQAQAATVREITTAIESVDQATQQNAAMVEEASAAARSLQSEVATLGQRTASFDIGKPRAAARPVAAKAPPVAVKPAAAPATRIEAYQSPVKPLPTAAVASLVRDPDDWDEF